MRRADVQRCECGHIYADHRQAELGLVCWERDCICVSYAETTP